MEVPAWIGWMIVPTVWVIGFLAGWRIYIFLRTAKPWGIERLDGTFEVLTATHCRVDKSGNLSVYRNLDQVALFKDGEWRYAERGLTAEQVDQRGIVR